MWCAGYTAEEFWALSLEARLRLAASDCLGWRYGTGSKVRFPYARPMLPASRVDRNGGAIDCSSFTAYCLATAYPFARWTQQRYAELQIMEAENPWSPISAVERAGVGGRISQPVKGVIALSQAWVDASTKDGDSVSGGHARIVWCLDDDTLLVLESSSRGGIGPRWTFGVTFSELERRYPDGVRLAALGPGHPSTVTGVVP